MGGEIERPEGSAASQGSLVWPVILVIAFLLMAGISTYHQVTTWKVTNIMRPGMFFQLGAVLKSDGSIFSVRPGSDLDVAGFKPGDRIISINGLDYVDEEGRVRMWTTEYIKKLNEVFRKGNKLKIRVLRANPLDHERPGLQEVILEMTVPGKSSFPGTILGFAQWLSCLLAAGIMLFYSARKSGTLAMRLFCLFLISLVGLFNYFFCYPEILGGVIILGFSGLILLGCFFHFSLVWPSLHPWKKRFPRLPYWGYIISGIFLVLHPLLWYYVIQPIFDMRPGELPERIHFLVKAFFIISFLIILVVLNFHQHKVSSELKRQQHRWFQLNMVFMAFTFLFGMIFVIVMVVPSLREKYFSISFYMLWAVGFYTILGAPLLAVTMIMADSNYRLDLVDTIFKKSLIYSVMSAILGGIVLLVAGLVAYLAQRWSSIREPWAIIAITIMTAILLTPVKNLLGRRLDRRLRGQVLDLRDFKDRVDEFIIKELEAGKLINHIVLTVQSILECAPAFMFLRAREDDAWKLAAFVNLSSVDAEALSSGPPPALTNYLEEKPEPTSRLKLVSRTDLLRPEEINTDLIEVLESIKTDTVVPIISHEVIDGILCLGPKPRKGVYTAEELAILGLIAGKVGMGLANAMAYEMVERSRNSLQQEVESQTRELKGAHEQMERLTTRMKYYLSPQLVEALAKDEGDQVRTIHKRVRLTIFFSDILGFTETTERMEPEELSELLNHYLTEMSSIALKHGGTIDKYVGDGMMIFFGAPEFTSDEDHALRCVRMAWEMQEKMKGLGEEWKRKGVQKPLQIRIGINSGYAAVGSFGSPERLDYTAIGGQVNLASRLETECEPGKILLSFSTNALLQDEFETVSKGEIEVKGIHYPVETFEVVGPR